MKKLTILVVILLAFSSLFWIDYFLSIKIGNEWNPLFSPINKFISFPVIILSVVLLYRNYPQKFKMAGLFLVSLFSFAFLWNIPYAFAQTSDFNGDFESTQVVSNSFGYTNNFLLGACSSDVRTVEVPTNWTISSSQVGGAINSVNNFDNKAITNSFKTSGAHAFGMWYIPPNPCEYNTSTSNAENVTQGITVTALSPIINITSNLLTLSFDIAPLNFYPIKCDSFLCNKKFYGNTCGVLTETGGVDRDDVDESECNAIPNGVPKQVDGSVRVEILFPNSTQIVFSGSGSELFSVPSQSAFSTKTIELSQFLPSGTSQINIRFIVYQPSTTHKRVSGFVIDNVELLDSTVVESPANQYVRDMTNLTAFPATISHDLTTLTTFSTYSFVSQKFDGVAIGYFRVQRTGGAVCTSGGSFHTEDSLYDVRLVYNDNSVLSVRNFSYLDGFANGADWGNNVGYVMIDVPNIDHVEMTLQPSRFCTSSAAYHVNITHNELLSSIRQTFSNSINGLENFQGYNELFPFIVYQNRVFPNGTQAYYIHNLAFQPQTFTGDQLFFLIKDAANNIKNIASDLKTVPSAFSTSATDPFIETFFPKPIGYFNTSTNWLSATLIASGDRITVVSNSTKLGNGTSILFYTSNTTVTFDPSNTTGFGGCVDMCIGTTFRDAFESSYGGNVSVCSFTFITNASQCQPVPVTPTLGQEFGGALDEPVGGDETQDFLNSLGVGWLGVFITPIFIILMVIVGIAGFIEVKVKSNGTVFALILLSLTLMLTFLEVFPIEVAILVIIIAGAIIANQIKNLIGGNGGGK